MKKATMIFAILVLLISTSVYAKTQYVGDWVVKNTGNDVSMFQIANKLAFGLVTFKETDVLLVTIACVETDIDPRNDIMFIVDNGRKKYGFEHDAHFGMDSGVVFIHSREVGETIISSVKHSYNNFKIGLVGTNGKTYVEKFNPVNFNEAIQLFTKVAEE